MTFSSKALLAVAVGAAALAAPASAATFILETASNTPLTGATYTTFNNLVIGSTTQATGTGITVSFASTGGTSGFVQGTQPFLYSAPTVANGNGASFGGQANGTDATTFVSSGIGTATLTLTTPVNYFGLLWGSIDAYNSITFNTADGLSQTFTGSQIGFLGQSHYVNFFSSSLITSVVARSTDSSFEFDNVATAAVPEPATWAMMIAGFGMVGFAMRRRQRAVARVSYSA
jgi:hypothetical protein